MKKAPEHEGVASRDELMCAISSSTCPIDDERARGPGDTTRSGVSLEAFLDARIVLLTRDNCAPCHAMSAWMSSQGIAFLEVNVTTNPHIMPHVRSKLVPLCRVRHGADRQTINDVVGFDGNTQAAVLSHVRLLIDDGYLPQHAFVTVDALDLPLLVPDAGA